MKDAARKQAVNEWRGKKIKTTNTTTSVNTNEVNHEQNQLIAKINNEVKISDTNNCNQLR